MRKENNMDQEYDQEYIDSMNAQMGMDDFDILESTKCPTCGKMVSEVRGIVAKKPFTAQSPMAGLMVWGAYDVPKQIICQGHSWVHFKFLYDGSERLVLMNLPEELKTKY